MSAAGFAPPLFELQLVTERLPELRHFYEAVVGLAPTVQDTRRGRVHFRLGEGQLILARADAEEALPAWPGVPPQLYEPGEPTARGPAVHGALHFAFHCDREAREEVLRRLRAAGRPVRGPVHWPGGTESWYTLDPDGNCMELIGPA